MTIEEKAREIALDYDKNKRPGHAEYYIGIDFWIEIDTASSYGEGKFTVALFDETLELCEEGEYVEDFIETRETIVDAVEQILHDTVWEEN